MSAPMPYAELRARQRAVYAAIDTANDVRFGLNRRDAGFMEWQLIAEACSREARRLHRIWCRHYMPKEWAA